MFRMHRNSLFSVLLRKPWWVSAAIGITMGVVATAVAPADWRGAASVIGFPFLVIAAIGLWRGRRVPTPAEVERTAQEARAMNWNAFADTVQAAFARDGWTVRRADASAHDFVLERGGRRMLVAARRWKSARMGLEPLRALQAVREAEDIADALCITLGDLSEPARRFAAQQRIAVWQAAELAQALRTR